MWICQVGKGRCHFEWKQQRWPLKRHRWWCSLFLMETMMTRKKNFLKVTTFFCSFSSWGQSTNGLSSQAPLSWQMFLPLSRKWRMSFFLLIAVKIHFISTAVKVKFSPFGFCFEQILVKKSLTYLISTIILGYFSSNFG